MLIRDREVVECRGVGRIQLGGAFPAVNRLSPQSALRDLNPEFDLLLGLVGGGAEGLLGEEGAERLQGPLGLAAVQGGGADPVGGADGVLVGRVGLEVAAEGGDPQIKARVVARLGEAEGAGDLEEGVGADVGRLVPLGVFEVAGEVGPGQPGREGLAGVELGLAQVEAGERAVVVAGVLSPTLVLNFVIYHSEGHLHISSQLQNTLITWEIIGLFIFLGAGIAGFNTFNGPKQGLCVGIAASFLIVGYQMSNPRFQLEEIIFTAFVIMTLSLVRSWFACRLFPPVLARRRRLSEAP